MRIHTASGSGVRNVWPVGSSLPVAYNGFGQGALGGRPSLICMVCGAVPVSPTSCPSSYVRSWACVKRSCTSGTKRAANPDRGPRPPPNCPTDIAPRCLLDQCLGSACLPPAPAQGR